MNPEFSLPTRRKNGPAHLMGWSGWLLGLSALLSGGLRAAEFVNLDFERARVPPTAPGEFGSEVDPALAFPGWTVGEGGSFARNYTLYNNLTLGSTAQVLVGPRYPSAIADAPLQGRYSAILLFGPSPELGYPALSQRGTIPEGANSIHFLVGEGPNTAELRVDGSIVPLLFTGAGSMAGDIAAYSGREVNLMFTTSTPQGPGVLFDDVRFSAQVVPEPSTFGLFGIGVLAVGLACRWDRRSRGLRP